jgi:NADH-quinone oxidoreductase subunit L
MPLYNFLLNKWYIDEFYDHVIVNPLKKIGKFLWKKGDQNTIDKFGPDGISKVVKFISNKSIKLQSGFIYDYAFVMLIGLSVLITYLILK